MLEKKESHFGEWLSKTVDFHSFWKAMAYHIIGHALFDGYLRVRGYQRKRVNTSSKFTFLRDLVR